MPENLQLEIAVIAPAYVWVTVLGNMQIALRHPENSSGPAAEIARDFGDHLLAKLIAEGVFTAEEGDGCGHHDYWYRKFCTNCCWRAVPVEHRRSDEGHVRRVGDDQLISK